MPALVTRLKESLGNQWLLLLILALIGVITNFGTAVLRLDRLVPKPKLVDFASYYVAAWAYRLDSLPYPFEPDLIASLTTNEGLYLDVPTYHSTPTWAALNYPFTKLRFPIAAKLWLILLLVMLIYSAYILLRISNPSFASKRRSRQITAVAILSPCVISFGPCMLSLTLGQNSIVLLPAVLLIGRTLASDKLFSAGGALGYMFASAAKVFPLMWIVPLLILRRRKFVVLSLALVAVAFGATTVHRYSMSKVYWTRFLPARTEKLTQNVYIDDQGLRSFIARLSQSREYSIPALDPEKRVRVIWKPAWELSSTQVSIISGLIVLFLLGLFFALVFRKPGADPEPLLYLFAMLVLVCFPHMERYNHVLLMPAMAWLWKRGINYRTITVVAYSLVGLSRLNHLWAMLLKWPLGPVVTGGSLYALFLLCGAMLYTMWRAPSDVPAVT